MSSAPIKGGTVRPCGVGPAGNGGADSTGPDGAAPLIGGDDLETPYWAQSQLEAARPGIWAVARGAPRTAALLVGWSWRAAPRWTLLAVALQLATAVATAFGLLSTVDVFTNLLAAGPTPQRVVDALPALAVVVGALVARGALQSASGAVQARLVPRIEERAQDELYSRLGRRRAGRVRRRRLHHAGPRAEQALIHLRFGASMVGDLAAAVVSVGAGGGDGRAAAPRARAAGAARGACPRRGPGSAVRSCRWRRTSG